MTDKTNDGRAVTNERAAVYVRKSTGKESDNRSIDEQTEATLAYAAEQGWQVAPRHIFKEVASAKNLKDRKQMQRLIAAIRDGQVRYVVCWKADRRARNFKESGWLDTEAEMYGASWHFVEGGAILEGLEDPDDRDLMESLTMYIDAKERRTISGRMQWGQDARVKAGGLKPGPKPPYGWERLDFTGPDDKVVKNGTLQQKPEEVPVVAKIFRLFVEDRASLAEVTRWLQSSGHPTPMGKPAALWSEMSVKTIIRNPCHMGVAATKRTESVPGTSGSRHRNEDEWEILENAPSLKPIVDEGTWRAANDALAENRRRSGGKKNPDNQGLLSYGHIFGVCPEGHQHSLGWRAGRYRSGSKQRGGHKCPIIGISAGYVDDKVWTHVTKLLNDPFVLLKRLKSQMSGDGMAEDLALAEAAVVKLEAKAKNAWAAIEDAKTEAARRMASERFDELAPALEAAEMECRSIAARAQAFKNRRSAAEHFIERLRADTAQLESLDLEGRRAIIRQLDVQVLVTPDKGKGIDARWNGTIGIMPLMIAPGEDLIDGVGHDDTWLDDTEDGGEWDDVEWEYDPWDDVVDTRADTGDTYGTGEEPAPRCNNQTRLRSACRTSPVRLALRRRARPHGRYRRGNALRPCARTILRAGHEALSCGA